MAGDDSRDWRPYSSVDWHNPVWLRAPGVEPVVMQWSFGLHRWIGTRCGIMGPFKVYWDLGEMEPTEWAPVVTNKTTEEVQ